MSYAKTALIKTQKWVYLKQVLYIVRSCPAALFISLSPFLSVYKRSSSDEPVPYACQAWWICMARDSRDSDLQYSQPTASVYRLCQLCAEVRQKNHIWIHVLEEMQ